MTRRPTSPDHFDDLYRANADPWKYGTSSYEAEKYSATLAALPRRRYRSGLEAGCSIGILSQLLATRCDRLMAIDVSEIAIGRARKLAVNAPNIRFEQRRIPQGWPSRRFDLVVLSEILYYLSPAQVAGTARRVTGGLDSDGTVATVNWLGETDAMQTGEQAADLFIQQARPALKRSWHRRTAHYRIDIFQRCPNEHPAGFARYAGPR